MSAFAAALTIAADLLRDRARELRSEEGRIASEWHKMDADMVAGELDRMAERIGDVVRTERLHGDRRVR